MFHARLLAEHKGLTLYQRGGVQYTTLFLFTIAGRIAQSGKRLARSVYEGLELTYRGGYAGLGTVHPEASFYGSRGEMVNAGNDQPVVVGSSPTGFPMLRDRIKKDLGNTVEPQFKLRPEVLLLPQIPKPLHGLAPRVILGRQWWDQTRKEAYRSTWFHCISCGVHKSEVKGKNKWLEAHEIYRTDYVIGRMYYIESVPLCPFCHAFIHCGRLQALLDKRQITQQRFSAILQHGERILAGVGLVKPLPHDGPMAEWSKWRLVIGRQMYKPKFKSLEEWAKFYNQEAE